MSIINKYISSISGIFKTRPKSVEFWECNDGTFSDSGSCNWHGGLKSKESKKYIISPKGKKKKLAATTLAEVLETGVTLIPIGIIKENRSWFQNRKTAYSERSVKNIIEAYKSGNFLWANFDAITVWPGNDGKLYVLSGHSRLEAFKRLCKMGAIVDNRDFCEIPAKVAEGLTLEQAKKVARESNTLSTKETLIERSQFYSRLRQEEGKSRSELEKLAKRLEGQNATQILAFSYLNPDGRTYNALALLDSADATSRANIQNIARWIGNARKTIPLLSNDHENELFDWLVTYKAYGTKKGQISNEREFKSRLSSIINRRTEFGVLNKKLNIQNFVSKSPVEKQYDERLEKQRALVSSKDKELKAKIKDLTNRGASTKQISDLTKGLEATLRRERIKLQQLIQKKSNVMQQAKNELSLFSIGAIFPTDDCGPFVECEDGTFSNSQGRGTCAGHGGIKGRKKAKKKEKYIPKEGDTENFVTKKGRTGTFIYVRGGDAVIVKHKRKYLNFSSQSGHYLGTKNGAQRFAKNYKDLASTSLDWALDKLEDEPELPKKGLINPDQALYTTPLYLGGKIPPPPHTITEKEFIKGIFDELYDFKSYGQMPKSVKSVVQAYKNTLKSGDQQNAEITRQEVLRLAKGRHRGYILQAYKEGKEIPMNVLDEYPQIKKAYLRKKEKPESSKLKAEKYKLINKALNTVPGSSKQKEIKKQLKKVEAKLKQTDQDKPKTDPNQNAFKQVIELANSVRSFKYENVDDIYKAFDIAYSLVPDVRKLLNSSAYTKKKLVAILSQWDWSAYSKQNEKKAYIVDSIVDDLAFMFLPRVGARSLPITIGKKFDAWQYASERLKKEWTTDSFREKKEEFLKQKQKVNQALENPQTLEDFKIVSRNRKLTEDEKLLLDKLLEADLIQKAERLREKVKEEKLRQKKLAKAAKAVSADTDFVLSDFQGTGKFAGTTFRRVQPTDRVDKETFRELQLRAKRLNGFWSKYAKGFLFEDPDDADQFAQIDKTVEKQEVELEKKDYEKFLEFAEKLEDQAAAELRSDRKVNTARRQRFAASAQEQAENDLYLAGIYRALADQQQKGNLKFIDWLSYKTDVAQLMNEINQAKYNYSKKVFGNDWWSNYKKTVANEPFQFKFKEHIRPGLHLRGWHMNQFAEAIENKKGLKRFAAKLKKAASRGEDKWYYISDSLHNDFVKGLRSVGGNYKYATWFNYISDSLKGVFRLKRLGLDDKDLLYAALLEFQQILNLAKGEQLDIKPKIDLELAELRRKQKGFKDFFFTNDQLAARMAKMAMLDPGDKVLEPSAGDGAIARAILREEPKVNLDVAEMAYTMEKYLTKQGFNVVANDFLNYSTDNKYDAIIMNPPFSKRQDAQHVVKAYKHLKPGGRLIALVGAGTWAASDKKAQQLKDLFSEAGRYNQILEDEFKDAGTGVRVVLLAFQKLGSTISGLDVD
jgi:protein-L-isoaspartate O-methyltransferase